MFQRPLLAEHPHGGKGLPFHWLEMEHVALQQYWQHGLTGGTMDNIPAMQADGTISAESVKLLGVVVHDAHTWQITFQIDRGVHASGRLF